MGKPGTEVPGLRPGEWHESRRDGTGLACIAAKFWFAIADCNRDPEKNLFRKLFPKQIPDIHKAGARTITFALVNNFSERKLRTNTPTKLNGDYRLHFRAEPSGEY